MTKLLPPPSLSTKGQWLFLNHYLNEIPFSETLGTNPDWICPSLDRPLLLTVLAKKIAERDLLHAEAVHARLVSQYGIKVPAYEPVLASPINVAFGTEGFASIDLRSPMIPQHVSLPTVSRRRLSGRQFRSLSFTFSGRGWGRGREGISIEAVGGGPGKKDAVGGGIVLNRATPGGRRTLIWQELIKARVECESFVEQMKGAQGS